MEIKIITGTTLLESISNTLEAIDPQEETFIVVPDRTTLQIEEMLFDTLNLTSTFNLNVIGLGNLALRYVGESVNPLTEIECVMFVKRAIEQTKEKLVYFKSTNIKFCQQIYKLISQFKSSSIKAEDIKLNTKKESLKRKLQDIKLIYEEFERLTEQRDDPSELIEKFVGEIEREELFHDVNFCFVAFDSFTAKHYELIRALCKNSKSVTIGLTAPLSNQENAYIYEKDIFSKIKKITLSLDASVNVVSPASKLTGAQEAVRNQLFGREKNAVQNKVRFFEGKNKRQEADFVAKMIAYEVFNGARYRDFAVAVSDLEAYKDDLMLAFEKNGIPYYFDISENASKSYCALLFKKIFTLAYKNFRKNDLLFILSSPLFDFPQEEIERVTNNLEEGGKVFYSLKNIDTLKNLVQNLSQNLQLGAEKIVDYIEENADKLSALGLDEKSLAIETQVPGILREILASCETVAANNSFSEMLSAIEIGLQTKQVSAIPSYYDEVYVGDITDSFFGKVKNLFVVGANAGVMPKVESDSSIFSDEELDNAFVMRKVEPTIKMINRRARFKLFSLLCDYENRLYVSYSLVGSDDKPLARSSVTNELLEICGKSESIIKSLLPENLADVERLKLAIGKSEIGAEEVMSQTSNAQLKGFLGEYLKIDFEKFKRFKPIKDVAEVLGLGKAIKPTEIERFYDCPFKFMCEKVLLLKDLQPKDITPLEVGSIVHSVLEKYGKQYAYKPLTKSQLDELIDSAIKNNFDFKSIPDGEVSLIRLKRDINRICRSVREEYEGSKFELWMLEEAIAASIGDKKFYGRVDRVDKFGDHFRVIDYKTGKIASNLKKELSVGKKLQLFAYAKFISEKTGLKCGGIYYFDAKAGYGASSSNPLVGLTNEELKDSVISDKYISSDELSDLEKEAEKLMLKASVYMEEGKFLPVPDENSCKYCPFKPICLYDSDLGARRLKGGANEQ